MDLPERLVPWFLRVTRANRDFVSADHARHRLSAGAMRPDPFGPPRRLRSDVAVDAGRRDGWPVYTVTPRRARPTDCVVYAHGGGWYTEISPQQWRFAAQVAAEARTTVIVPIYPLVPFGTAEQVVGAFVDMAREYGQTHGNVRLAGDSAGGQIVLSTALELRDRFGQQVSQTVLISPALDLSWSNPRITTVQPDDHWLGVPGSRVFTESWRGHLDVTDQRVSPGCADLRGLGPISVFTGTHDILNPDARRLADKGAANDVDVALYERDPAVHVWALLPTAAGRHARSQIATILS